MSKPIAAIQDLLLHADFLRSLARDLVADRASGDDLAQEVWVRAMESPPRHVTSLRGWLATTTRNLLANRRRSTRRRRERERRAAAPEAILSPQEVLAREQIRERVVQAVLELPEPFRQAVLLRYYEGLAPREIAERLGVPAATVRTRVSRGLERLRVRFDGEESDDRRAWALALSPWLRHPPAGTATLAGVLAVKKLIAVVAATVLIVLSWAVLAWDPPSVTPVGNALVAPQAGTGQPVAVSSDDRVAVRAELPMDGAPRALPVYPADRQRGTLVGQVVDAFDQPVPGVRVEARPYLGNLPPMMLIADDRTTHRSGTTDREGRFRLVGLEAGPTLLLAAHVDGRRARRLAVLAGGAAEESVRVRLGVVHTSGDHILVVALDAETGQLVVGARVELFGWTDRDLRPEVIERSLVEPLAAEVTGEDGVAAFRGLGLKAGAVFVEAPDGRNGWAPIRPASNGLVRAQVRLGSPGSLHGELLGLPADALHGATVRLLASWSTNAYSTAGGRRLDVPVRGRVFALPSLPAGRYSLSLYAPGGARLVVGRYRDRPNWVVPPVVEVARGELTTVQLEVALGSRIDGLVQSRGVPLAGARVRAVIAPRWSNFPQGVIMHGAQVWRLDSPYENGPQHPLSEARASTDSEGRYVLDGLQPGSYRVEVVADGLSFDRRLDVEVPEGGRVRLRHELLPAGVLQVAVLDASYLGVSRPGESDAVALAIHERTFATFPNLAAGRYVVSRYHSNSRVPPVPVGEAEVVAGRTTFLDLRAASVRAVLVGRVSAGGQPLPGIPVKLSRNEVMTDSFGAFRVVKGHPLVFHRGVYASLTVQLCGIKYACVPTVPDPVTFAEFDIDLGSRFLAVEAMDASGTRVPVQVEFSAELPREASGTVRRAWGTVRIPAEGDGRLGPLPPVRVRGTVAFPDGYSVPFDLEPDAEPVLRVKSPATATLRVRVLWHGRPVAGKWVLASTWYGPESAPVDDEAFLAGDTAAQSAVTSEDGWAQLAVLPGTVRVSFGSLFDTEPVRVNLQLGSSREITVPIQ